MTSSASSSTVVLYRYDLTMGMARSMGPMLIGRSLEGIWHTSIVVFGKEYYFDGGVGIMADANPGRTRFGTPYRTEVLGVTTKREDEFFAWTQRQRTSGFGPNDYHLLNNNCNSFSDAASVFLLGRHIPQDILEMIPALLSTPMGQMLGPMLAQATSGGRGVRGVAAPVAPLAQPRPPLFPPSSDVSVSPTATSGAASGDMCLGLLSPHHTVTESDEEDLMLAQAMLESNETIADGPRSPPENFEKAISGLTLLQTVIANICDHPTEVKYRALSMESNAYKTKLKPLEPYGVADVLRIAGFVRRPHSSGNGGEQWFLSDAAGSAAVLQRVGEMLAVTISSIEGAAADAAKERARAAAVGANSCSQKHDEHCLKEGNSLEAPPPPSRASLTSADMSSASTNAVNENGKAGGTLRYCYPPCPKDWIPLEVGWESGAPLFSIHCLSSNYTEEGPYCFGKCRLSAHLQHLQAYYCSSDGREVEVHGGYEVLCVRRGYEGSVTWVPARLACNAAAAAAASSNAPSPSFIFAGYGRFGVARAEHGSGVHPGVMEPSGRCVIPYGGHCVVVTAEAEVLCETARLPPTLAQTLQELKKGAELSKLLREASGQPIGSFDELLNKWRPPVFYVKPQAIQHHTHLTAAAIDWDDDNNNTCCAASSKNGSERSDKTIQKLPTPSTRLLACHDFGGGYTVSERQLYTLEESEMSITAATNGSESGMKPDVPCKRITAIESAYTVGYWDRMDCFVYFTHQRISVPPRTWIHEGHRHGATVLGTIITEGAGGAADLEVLLSDAKRMAAIIGRLVQLCDVYGFDGYLLNVENNLPPKLAKRLVVFCTQLRRQLNLSASLTCTARLVIWYDAITIDGTLAYQNALTPRNKPFFDACDGLFTNYFWNPVHIAMTSTAAGSRRADVFVGVDVFGRSMFGGGGYNTCVAAEEAVHANLSVALFAPGWTMECESKGTRDGFEQAESRLWSRLQDKFAYHARLFTCGSSSHLQGTNADSCNSKNRDDMCAWTAFQSGVGYHFYVNGCRITGPGSATVQPKSKCTTSAWCDLSGAHALPPFYYEAPPLSSSSSAASIFVDPISAMGTDASPPGPFAAVPLLLPAFSLKGSMYGGRVRAAWRYDKAWFGDRCLGCLLPPMVAAEVLRWYVRKALPAAVAVSSASNVPPLLLHIELVLSDAEVASSPAKRGSVAAVPAEAHGGLRLGLYSASRGAFYVTVWEKAANNDSSATLVALAGVDGVQVRVTVTYNDVKGDENHIDPPSGAVPSTRSPFAGGWRRVHYELQNTSAETLHLTSVSVANSDPSRTLQLCIGAVAVYQGEISSLTSTSSPHVTDNEEESPQSKRSVLHASDSHVWASHVTHPTGKGAEQVLVLQDADQVFAGVRAKHGVRSTVVLFASITSSSSVTGAEVVKSSNNDDAQGVTRAASSITVDSDDHHMYLGQYSVDPADETAYKGSLLIPLSLPADRVVKRVYYHVVQNGY